MADSYFISRMAQDERGMVPYFDTTAKYIDFISAKYADALALSDGEKSLTYAQLGEEVAHRRALLQDRGLGLGDNVGLLDGNTVNAVVWFLALTSSGCMAVMLPAQLPAPALKASAARFELKACVAGEALVPNTAEMGIPVIRADETSEKTAPACADLERTTRCALFFTGGTTGTPKGVVLNHGAIMRGSLNGTYREGTIFGQTFLAVLPFTHVFGLVFSMLSGLYTGSQMYVSPMGPKMFQMLAVAKPTTIILVPGAAEMLAGAARMRGAQMLGGRLKLVICGGAPVPARLSGAWAQFGATMLEGYGLTETANLVCGNLDTTERVWSVGKQYPEQEMKLVNGEIWVKGDMLFDGYWKDPEATAAVMEDGWFKTGDLAEIDKDGYVTIVGRIKNLILLPNGENVSPEEVENAFYACPAVKDCLASEGELNGTPVIELTVQPQPGVDDETLLKACEAANAKLPALMQVGKFTVRHEDFKRTASMKIARNQ